jgi:hypothetical protein
VVMVAAGGCRIVVGCGCLQRTAAAGVAFGNGQCGVGLRRRMTLAASTLWDDLACSGSWRVAQLGWAIRCGTSSKDGASDFFRSLAWQWRFCARVKQEGEVDL